MKRSKEKDPKVLIALGARLAEAKRTLSAADYEAFKYNEPELRHEAYPEEVTVDKAERLRRLASMPVIHDNLDKLPRTGWAALRELSKLNEMALRCLFARGAIGPHSTREDIDRLRRRRRPKRRSASSQRGRIAGDAHLKQPNLTSEA
jgi:hypothetical protein